MYSLLDNILNCAASITDSFDVGENELPFVLDDLGCTGSESNLLECLPQHNCVVSVDQYVGVSCSRKGGED